MNLPESVKEPYLSTTSTMSEANNSSSTAPSLLAKTERIIEVKLKTHHCSIICILPHTHNSHLF